MEKNLTKNFENQNIPQENNFDSIKITLASPEKIKSWSYGEIKKPETDASLVADSIARQLEKRVAFRKAMKKSGLSAIKLGAKGIKIICGGRLGGAEIARSEKFSEGSVPLHTLRADIDYATARALTTYGIIGIKVWLYKGESKNTTNRADDKKEKAI